MDFYRINEEYNKYLQRFEKKTEELQRYLISSILIETNLLLVQLCKFMA